MSDLAVSIAFLVVFKIFIVINLRTTAVGIAGAESIVAKSSALGTSAAIAISMLDGRVIVDVL